MNNTNLSIDDQRILRSLILRLDKLSDFVSDCNLELSEAFREKSDYVLCDFVQDIYNIISQLENLI